MSSKVRVPASANPMVDNFSIENAIYDSGYTFEKFANLIGLSRYSLRQRLDDGRWSVLEAWKVCSVLGLDFEEIFFAFPERLTNNEEAA